MTTSALARRSSLDACTATRGSGVVFGHAALDDEPLDRRVGGHIHDDNSGQPAPARLDEQRHIEHDDPAGVLLGGDPPRDLGTDGGMHDRVQVAERIGVAEHDLGQPGPVQTSVRSQHARTETVDDRREDRLPGLLECSGDRVSVDDDRSVAGQERRNRGLARADAPGQPDENHRRDGTWARSGVNHRRRRADHLP